MEQPGSRILYTHLETRAPPAARSSVDILALFRDLGYHRPKETAVEFLTRMTDAGVTEPTVERTVKDAMYARGRSRWRSGWGCTVVRSRPAVTTSSAGR